MDDRIAKMCVVDVRFGAAGDYDACVQQRQETKQQTTCIWEACQNGTGKN